MTESVEILEPNQAAAISLSEYGIEALNDQGPNLIMGYSTDRYVINTVFSRSYAYLRLLAHPPAWALSDFQI